MATRTSEYILNHGGSIKYDDKYHMHYASAFGLFCNISGSGAGNVNVNVWNWNADDEYNEDAPDSVLTWNAGTSVPSPTIGKYIVVDDYKTKVRDQYAGVYGTHPRYKTLATDNGYQLGFTVPESWSYDAFPQKVEVELFEQNNSFDLVSTGLTGSYSLCNLGTSIINIPQWMQGGVWPEIHEWVDDANATGTLLKVADTNVSMPYDWTSVVFLRHKIGSGVFAYPHETMDPPTEEDTVTYVLNLIYEKIKASADEVDKWMGFDWYMTEAQLYNLAVSQGASPVDNWYKPDGTALNLQANGTRMFGIINFSGSPETWPKAALPQDTGAMVLMEVMTNTYGYAYTFPDVNNYPTTTEENIQMMSRTLLHTVKVTDFTPAPQMGGGTYEDSVIYGLPNTIIFRANMLNTFIAKYAANSTIVAKTLSDRVESKELWTAWLSGTLNNLLFVSPAAYVGVFGEIELVPFVKDVWVASLLQNASYRFFFEEVMSKNITFDEAQEVYVSAKFATVFSDKKYEVRIFGDFGFDNITAGSQPITISEESTKYAFEPIRNQSGYIQLLNSNATQRIKQIIPQKVTDRPVGLYDVAAQEYVWLGFIKPVVFESNPYAYRELIKLPIIGLSYAARSIEFEPVFPNDKDATVGGVFATALYQMMKAHPVYIEDVVFDYSVQFFGSVGGAAVPLNLSWMKARINTSFFRSTDDEGIESWAYDCEEVLKTLCEFFGLTMRIHGKTVYFLALDDVRTTHRLGKVRFSSLVATGFVEDYQPTVTYISKEEMENVFAADFASTQTVETLTPALSEVSVQCQKDIISDNVNIFGDWVVEKEWADIVEGTYPRNFTLWQANTEDLRNISASLRLFEVEGRCGYNGWEAQAKAVYVNFQTVNPSISAILRRTYLIQNAVLSISMKTKGYVGNTEADTHSEKFEVVVTNVDTGDVMTTLVTMINGDVYKQYDPTEKKLPEYSGKKIMLYDGDSYLYGRIKVEVICKDQAHTNPEGATGTYVCVITELVLNVTPLLGFSNPKTEFRHKIFKYAAGGKKSVTSALISSYIPSIQNRVTSVERFSQSVTDYNPSKNLAQRMADYHGKPRQAYKLPVKGVYFDSDINPVSYVDYNQKQYIPIAVETDVKSESYNLTLIEMPTEIE